VDCVWETAVTSRFVDAAKQARAQLETEQRVLEAKGAGGRSAKESARLDALEQQIAAASSDIARLEATAPTPPLDAARLVEFVVRAPVHGATLTMRAKASALVGKVVRTFCQQSGIAGDGATLRGLKGERYANDAPLGSIAGVDGAEFLCTIPAPPATIMYRIVDTRDNFLEMRSKNSVRVSKLLAGWIANCPPGSLNSGELVLVLGTSAEPLNEHLTIGEVGITNNSLVRVLPAPARAGAPVAAASAAATSAPPTPPAELAKPSVPAPIRDTPASSVPPKKAPRSDLKAQAAALRNEGSGGGGGGGVGSVDPKDAFRARWAFDTTREREMSLALDDLVLVVRRKEEWWKGIRARDGQTGWFPATRVVPATPKECADIATALSTLQRAPETMKRKERRAAASRGQGEAQLEANFGAEPKAVESDPEAQREVAELERLAAAHESDARRMVELMRAAAQGRCGEQDEFEHVPLSPGCHAINVGGRPIALLLGDEIELCIDDHALKIEVLLNTVLTELCVSVRDRVRRRPGVPGARGEQ
jgi:hypothetical protein